MANPMYQRSPRICASRSRSGRPCPGQSAAHGLELRERNNNASRNTVRDAIKWLINLGLVETRPGPGRHLRDRSQRPVRHHAVGRSRPAWAATRALVTCQCPGRGAALDQPGQVEIQQASADVAISLQIAEGTEGHQP